ncbi:hypothetical protein ACH44C_31935 [Streptomyces purpureus]|uniref:hypothetical protein n=1 Tax=Streptomyces purpureus TaxID=1951 RepID=UPI0037BAC1F9
MARMRRGLVHVLAWSLATGAAVTLSWWGVHTVMAGTAYDPPRALPITADTPLVPATGGSSSATPDGPGSAGPSASTSPSGSPGTAPGPSRRPAPSRTPSASRDTPATPPSHQGKIKSTSVAGGRVVFDIGPDSAELVSATPASGWQMQLWKQPTWIRVTFTQGGREISVFCVWHDTAPRVEIDER